MLFRSKPETGARISGLDQAEKNVQIALFHAATSRGANGEWLTAGGRVLGVTATGASLAVALDRAYRAVSKIQWEGMHYRRDIGRSSPYEAAAANRKPTAHR